MHPELEKALVAAAALSVETAYAVSQLEELPPTAGPRWAKLARKVATGLDEYVADVQPHGTTPLLPQNLLALANLIAARYPEAGSD
ncbi:hypothetical protein [Sphingobium sp.]|uniref:hypothetical protein n=1 Tax=Sphingobium sp. TaxID=1912891 RepID=UPI002C0154BB|nr:hypothetical protein [Sphingobium sp.]HUD92312.1 hypothetical protein [Sphingobium sp.]